MKKIDYNGLPRGVTTAGIEIRKLTIKFLEFQKENGKIEPEKLIKLSEASEFLKLTSQVIKSKVMKGELKAVSHIPELTFSSFELVDFSRKSELSIIDYFKTL